MTDIGSWRCGIARGCTGDWRWAGLGMYWGLEVGRAMDVQAA